eukprot:5185210-Prymnesium_polylepis.1
MELAFDTIMDPTSTLRLRPGEPVSAHLLEVARRKLESHLRSDVLEGTPPWRLLSERFSILEPELKCAAASFPGAPPAHPRCRKARLPARALSAGVVLAHRARCLSIAALPLREFLEPLQQAEWSDALLDPDFEAALQQRLPAGMAALREDAPLAQRHRALVPGRVSEAAFFFCYFCHVREHRRAVLPPVEQVASPED